MLKAAHRRAPRGNKIRVLVVDDSVVIRRLVTHALSEDQSLEVAGSASNGAIALQKMPQLNPDVVTLDIEMPEMDGLATLREIRKTYPDVCVIMFSTLTERGTAATIEALTAGADDYVTKAANVGSLDQSLANLRHELVPKIKQFFTEEAPPLSSPSRPISKIPVTGKLPKINVKRQIVVLGVSTGGPSALAEIIPLVPRDFPLPILIVQHMPPVFTKLLAERLGSKASVKVAEAVDGSPLQPGTVLIAPGDYHLEIRRTPAGRTAALSKGAPENSCRPAADVLFRSAAESYGSGCIAAVLTGMGQDGLRGVEHLKAKGAFVIAQDQASSVVWGMPGYVARAGLADTVLPLHSIVPEIIRQAGL